MPDIIRGTHIILARHLNLREHPKLVDDLTEFVSKACKATLESGFQQGLELANTSISSGLAGFKEASAERKKTADQFYNRCFKEDEK